MQARISMERTVTIVFNAARLPRSERVCHCLQAAQLNLYIDLCVQCAIAYATEGFQQDLCVQ